MILNNLQKSLQKTITRGLTPLKKPEPLRLAEWADKHFYLSTESSSIEGKWSTLPYQRSIMNVIGSDDVRVVTWRKSARTGYTKIICACIGYNIEHRKRNQLIYQPVDDDAKEFVKDEIDPMIRDVPLVGGLLRADPEKKSKNNTLGKKAFIGSTLDIKGGKSARNYRRMTKDVVYYDELDGFEQDVDGEGSPISLGDVRIATSSFPKSVRGSTPGLKHGSQIESSMDDADLVFRRYLPCPECNKFQYLKWSNITWTKNNPSSTRYACEGCGAAIEYSQYPDMDAEGQWRTADGHYLDDEDNFRGPDNKLIDPPYHVGFIIWAAYSYFSPWTELVAEWLAANKAKKKGDITKLKTFINTRMGEAWEDEGETIEPDNLYKRREKYAAEVPMGALLLLAAVDIQKDRQELEIIGYGPGEESWGIERRIIYGDPTQPGIWKELDLALDKTYIHESGATMKILGVGIDSGYLTTEVYNYTQPRESKRIFALKGDGGAARPIITASIKKRPGKKPVKLFIVGVDGVKGIIYSRLNVEEPGPGYCHFPISYDQEFFDQLTAEKIVKKYKRGFAYTEWEKIRLRNEALDIRAYALAILKLLNPVWETWEKRFYEVLEARKKNEPVPRAVKRARRVVSSGVKL